MFKLLQNHSLFNIQDFLSSALEQLPIINQLFGL